MSVFYINRKDIGSDKNKDLEILDYRNGVQLCIIKDVTKQDIQLMYNFINCGRVGDIVTFPFAQVALSDASASISAQGVVEIPKDGAVMDSFRRILEN